MIRDVRRVLAREGPAGLEVDDLVRDDLQSLGWSGGSARLPSVGRALDRVESGEVEYLVVRAPTGYPIAKGGIDYRVEPGTGTLCQLVTADELRGLGIGARLIAVAEAPAGGSCSRAGSRGRQSPREGPLRAARLQRSPPRIRGVDVEDADGTLILYEAELAVLRKRL